MGFDAHAHDEVALNGVLTVSGKPFAIGLQWHHADENPVKEGRQALRSSEGVYNLFGTRGGAVPQFALGSTEFGHAEKMPVLAAHIADEAEGAWLGAFEVPQGIYFLAIKDDSVLAESDRVFSEDEARQYYLQYLQDGTWATRIAPKSWDIDQTIEMDLDQVVRGKTRCVLRPASVVNLKLVAIGTASIIIACAGYFAYAQYEQRAEAARIEAMREAIARRAIEKPVIPPVPWEGVPSGVDFMSACAASLQERDYEVGGWSWNGAECVGSRVTMLLRRNGGTINWIATSLNREDFRPNILPRGDNDAVVSWSMPKLKAYEKMSPGGSIQSAQRYLYSQMDERFVKFRFGKPASGDGYASIGFSFVTAADPREFAGILYPIPALTMKRVARAASGEWTIEGEIYERREFIPPAR